jgi:tetratricopeptide (TPR) repeat protein
VLLQVVPDQPEHVALYHIAAAQLATGDTAPAEATLLSALAGLPAADQAAFALNAGNLCYQQGARAAAARVYRAGFAHGGNLVLAGNFAWQLATDRDDAVRRGAEALALARQAVALSPDDLGAVNALAAALAETGDFPAAVTTATRALTLVRATGDKNAEAGFVARLESYRAGRPWRQ